MTFYIEKESKQNLDIEYEKIITDVINLSLDFEKVPYECEISITLVDEDEIHRINKEFREIDKATDVLSFPMNEFLSPSKFDDEFEERAAFNFDTGELLLGDIIISITHIKNQALEYGHSEKRELAFLVVHSILHLLGYDHLNQNDEEEMFKRQNLILLTGGYER